MTAPPRVSVVMSVYNGERQLRPSIQSVLAQEGVDLELVIVDDGSTDGTAAVLDDFARRDGRIRVVQQENQGLTKALIHGCALARGSYIARQDAGDLYLPWKLARQIEAFTANPRAALVSCGTRFVGPGGEILYELTGDGGNATQQLLTLDVNEIRGPFGHGSVLFRRDLYEQAGGYRPQFYFCQDLDLWIRMAELGEHVVARELLFQVMFAPGSISGHQRAKQVQTTKVILECARLRREGQSEAPALSRAEAIRPDGATVSPRDLAGALYFVGACLRRRDDPAARKYFVDALRTYPLHLRSAVRVLFG